MSTNNTPPTNETVPPTPQQEGIPIPPDIRGDNLDPATKGEASQILKFNIFEKKTYLSFKIAAFILIIALGAGFLGFGLWVSIAAIDHIKEIQITQLKQNIEKVELTKLIESNKIIQEKSKINAEMSLSSACSIKPITSDKLIQAKNSSQTSTNKKDHKEESSSDSLGSTMVSTGSIVTLIAFILGVGLTLLLTLLKFTFSANEPTNQNQDDCVTIAGPLSELLQSIASYIKKKIGLN